MSDENDYDSYPSDNDTEEVDELDKECVICMEILNEYKSLKCGHKFHIHCLDTWLKEHDICPTCRTRCVTKATIIVEPASQIQQTEYFTRANGLIDSERLFHIFMFDILNNVVFRLSLAWIAKTEDGNSHEVKEEFVGNSIDFLLEKQQKPSTKIYNAIEYRLREVIIIKT